MIRRMGHWKERNTNYLLVKQQLEETLTFMINGHLLT
jgi:hypothetical protein